MSGLGCAGRSARLRELPELPPANDLEIADHSFSAWILLTGHEFVPQQGTKFFEVDRDRPPVERAAFEKQKYLKPFPFHFDFGPIAGGHSRQLHDKILAGIEKFPAALQILRNQVVLSGNFINLAPGIRRGQRPGD